MAGKDPLEKMAGPAESDKRRADRAGFPHRPDKRHPDLLSKVRGDGRPKGYPWDSQPGPASKEDAATAPEPGPRSGRLLKYSNIRRPDNLGTFRVRAIARLIQGVEGLLHSLRVFTLLSRLARLEVEGSGQFVL